MNRLLTKIGCIYMTEDYPFQERDLDRIDTDDTSISDDGGENTVELHTAVDVHGASAEQKEMYRTMSEMFERQFRTFVEKNMDYGSSFETAGQVDQLLGEGPFDSALEANLYKLFTRMQDKQQRLYQLSFCENERHVDGESNRDTAKDLMNYAAMFAYLLEQERFGTHDPTPCGIDHATTDMSEDEEGDEDDSGDTESFTSSKESDDRVRTYSIGNEEPCDTIDSSDE